MKNFLFAALAFVILGPAIAQRKASPKQKTVIEKGINAPKDNEALQKETLLKQEAALHKIDQLIQSNETEQALALIQNELTKNPSSGLTIVLENKKSEILITLGKLTEAETLLLAVKQKDASEFLQAITLTNLGNLYLNKGRNDLALESLQSALTKFQNTGQSNTKEAAQCLANLALVYTYTGKYNQAKDNGLLALQIRQQLFGENSEETAASYNDLGLVYTSADPDKALEYYDKALPIYERLHGNTHPKIAIANTNSGIIYRQLELYGDAVNNFETALAIWKKIYPGGHPNEAFVLSNLGQTYVKMKNVKAAEDYFQKALTIYQAAYGAKHPEIASTLNQIGTLKLTEGKYDEAIQDFQKAIIANVNNFNNTNTEKNPAIVDFYNGYVLLYSLRLKAEALETRYGARSLKLKDLEYAMASLHSCDTLIDNIRHHSTDESDKIALGEQANEVYEDGVRIAQSMSEITVNSKYYRETAFYFAEKSKSAVLQEAIADANAKSFAGIPQALVEEEKRIKFSLTFLTQKLSQKPAAEEEKYLRESIFNLNREYNELIKKLENEFPNYYNLKYNQAAPTIAHLQKALDAKTAIVSFFISESHHRIYQFIITSKKFTIRNLTLPDQFDRLVKGFSNSLYYSNSNIFNDTGTQLSKILAPHLASGIEELIIIPSGKLGTLPFEALPYRRPKDNDFNSVYYLSSRYAISYEFSAGLIAQKSLEPAGSESSTIFLCAPVQFPEKDNLNDLPGTEQEVATIAGLFTAAATSVVKHDEANESRVKSNDLKNFSYLHFATHGVVDENDPELSRIFLNTNNEEDGNLFAGEIYNLDLNAKLAVLSACQTGLGKLSKGEGVIGLSRALIYAGSQNLIVSFWSVADESTALLMTDFYKYHLQQKMSFRKALQQSKIKMMKEGNFSAPYYWAPFVLIGN
jgi:CHAT domain-containing protein/Tfp pilus assembly protein PilF